MSKAASVGGLVLFVVTADSPVRYPEGELGELNMLRENSLTPVDDLVDSIAFWRAFIQPPLTASSS
jgi:hypothetical protein